MNEWMNSFYGQQGEAECIHNMRYLGMNGWINEWMNGRINECRKLIMERQSETASASSCLLVANEWMNINE